MKKVASIILIIMLLFSITSVKAADEKNLTFKSNKTEINRGEEVVLTISSNELTGIEGILKYDKTVWTLENKTSQNSFTLNDETGKFALANIAGEGNISVDITLKSKKETTVDSSTIKIEEIVGSDKTGGEYKSFDKKEVTIKFKTPQNTKPSTNNQPSNNPQQSSSTTNLPKNNTSVTKNIPYTGVEDIFTVIIILGVLSFIFYLGYRKYNY